MNSVGVVRACIHMQVSLVAVGRNNTKHNNMTVFLRLHLLPALDESCSLTSRYVVHPIHPDMNLAFVQRWSVHL